MQAKVAERPPPTKVVQDKLLYGVPLFLTQLAELLKIETTSSTPAPVSAIGISATRHGNELLRMGFSVGQVVHTYGDVCQAVTELAHDVNFTITTDEFHSLNRALDNAIAEAVTEYGRERESEIAADEKRSGLASDEQRGLLCTALTAWQMLTQGTVGVRGSTGSVLTRSLEGLRTLYNRSPGALAIPDPKTILD